MLRGQFPTSPTCSTTPPRTCSPSPASTRLTGARSGPPTPSNDSTPEIKRRTRVVGLFPHDSAIARLVTGVVVEAHDEWAVAERRYLSEESMAKLHEGPPPTAGTKEAPLAITA